MKKSAFIFLFGSCLLAQEPTTISATDTSETPKSELGIADTDIITQAGQLSEEEAQKLA